MKWCPYIVKEFKGLKHIYDPILMCNFYAISGVSEGKARERFLMAGTDYQSRGNDGAFQVHKIRGMEVGVIWSNDKGINLNHECLHGALWALRTKGIVTSEDSEELLAYYQGFLFRCITKK